MELKQKGRYYLYKSEYKKPTIVICTKNQNEGQSKFHGLYLTAPEGFNSYIDSTSEILNPELFSEIPSPIFLLETNELPSETLQLYADLINAVTQYPNVNIKIEIFDE